MVESELVDVIVPVFNEEEGLPEFIDRLLAVPLKIHPIFIDNASMDNSLQLIRQVPGATIIQHETNEGYGASLRDGILAATAEKVLIIDADCEYPPEALPELAAKLDHHRVVYASRFLDSNRSITMPLFKRAGNTMISSLFNLLFHQQTTDLYTGSKGFQRAVIQDIPMLRHGFEHVLEIAARLARKNVTIREIHVAFRPRQTGSAKMKHIPETLKYLLLVVYYFFVLPRHKG